jgi:hypothetical protein
MKKSENRKSRSPTYPALFMEKQKKQTNTADRHQQQQSGAKKGTQEYPGNSGQKNPQERVSLAKKRSGLHRPRKN